LFRFQCQLSHAKLLIGHIRINRSHELFWYEDNRVYISSWFVIFFDGLRLWAPDFRLNFLFSSTSLSASSCCSSWRRHWTLLF
jgi:hypothetical protein